ncbi:MAG: tRNA (N6-isopentenyl adenosine(37)-C2)-methylthiotransferase MiaB [Chlamydiae bacterium]|nr:tRNA (N6-isopentenyl adenosine(37)-C2)-methylthiotransferase MiaB [Chlamydiota bacterium]
MKTINTFFIRTYGCQMNENDSEILATQLENRGLKKALVEEKADLLIFNTCSVRDLAERKVLGKIGRMGKAKKRQIIGIAGCMAQSKKEKLLEKFSHVDFLIGTNNISDINKVLDEVLATSTQVSKTEERYETELDYLFAKRDNKLKASVSIIRGCDKFCTYCIVPYTRGREISRPFESILAECQSLAHKGYKEIVLLGQNVNSYGKDFKDQKFLFHDLLYKLDAIKGLERIRFLTSHPVDITLDLMYAIRDLGSVCEYVHFPLQAGSNKILKKMHRIYTKEEYLEKVNLLYKLIPDIALGTDIIVGFPTETDEEFEETYALFKEIKYSQAFIFAYSPRKNTPSYRFTDDVTKEQKGIRLQKMLDLFQTVKNEKNESLKGSIVEVLVEEFNLEKNQLKGKTRQWDKVIFFGDKSLLYSLQKVKITAFNHHTLIGELILSH